MFYTDVHVRCLHIGYRAQLQYVFYFFYLIPKSFD